MRIHTLMLSLLLLAGTIADAAAVELEAATRTIVLVRHGHYAPDPSADAKLGPALTSLGIARIWSAHVSPVCRKNSTRCMPVRWCGPGRPLKLS